MKAMKQVQGICCYYNKLQVNESKKWVVVLHGWDQTGMESWLPTARELNKQGFNVLLLDLPGFGQSESPSNVWGSLDYATFVEETIKSLDIVPLLLVGHDFGGAVASRLIIQKNSQTPIQINNGYSKGYKGLVLIAPTLEFKTLSKNPAFSVQLGLRNIYQLVNKYPLLRPATNMLKNLLKNPIQIVFKEQIPQKSKSIMSEIRIKTIAEKLIDSLSAVTIPSMVLWGADDLYTPVSEAGNIVGQLKHAQLKVYDGARHQLQLTNSARIANDIVEFFEKNKYNFAVA